MSEPDIKDFIANCSECMVKTDSRIGDVETKISNLSSSVESIKAVASERHDELKSALKELGTQMKDRGVELRSDLKGIVSTIVGNGRDGLLVRVARLEESKKDLEEQLQEQKDKWRFVRTVHLTLGLSVLGLLIKDFLIPLIMSAISSVK